MRLGLLLLCLGLTAPVFGPVSAASPPKLVEPSLHLHASASGTIRVALTFDACDGQVDLRILDALLTSNIPATIFVTGKWLARNPEAFAKMLTRPDLFEIEDHGARHLPAVDFPTEIYGIKAAGSPAAVEAEVTGGAQDILKAGGVAPHWFRGATAKYDASAMAQITGLGLEIAGYSLSGDGGSVLSEKETARRIGGAQDGDVILSHINQPHHAAGAGVVAGIAALLARGVVFVRLEDAFPPTPPSVGN